MSPERKSRDKNKNPHHIHISIHHGSRYVSVESHSPAQRAEYKKLKKWAELNLGVPCGGKVEVINGHVFCSGKDYGAIPPELI
jgi:hypothetical protein